MRHDLIASARRIRAELKASENDYDVALANNARLVATMLDARRERGLPAAVGREALGRAVEAIAHAAKARESLLSAHDELAQLNVRELAMGDVLECPEGWTGQLAVVQSENQAA